LLKLKNTENAIITLVSNIIVFFHSTINNGKFVTLLHCTHHVYNIQ